jgi:excisionase family DNA binding protein
MEQGRKPAYCTTREAAKRLGVSLRTAQLWSESGILEAWKTDGGHRRITQESVDRLLNEGRHGTVAKTESYAGVASMPMASSQGVASSGNTERLRVLVVEDDNVLLKLYRLRIAQWGLPVDLFTASNAYEALILVGKELPDLMVTDLIMPGLDGFEMVRTLSGSAYREGMEIVVVTGLDHDGIAARGGLPAGIKILFKPVPFDNLRDMAASLLARRTIL